MAQDPRPGNILDSEPFAYRYSKSWEEIRNVGRKRGIRFVGVQEEMGDFIKRPILGNRNTFTEKLRSAQYRSILGFNFVSKQRAAGKKYSGLTVSLTGAGGYGSELDLNIVDSQFADVGVSKRGIVDYLSKYEKHDLFSWAKQNTIGYSNWNDVFGNAASIARWESKYGQLAKDAVFKLNESAGGEGVWFGLDKVPSNLRGNKNLLVQPKIDILEEFRVVHAGGEAVDISYRWGSPGVRDFVEKTGLSRVLKFAGIKSGKPELLQPVTGRMAERLKKFSETYARTLPYGVGALDIAQTREGFKVIEAQKKFGNFSLPWVRGKIEYALTGRIPLEAKIGGGLAAAAVGGVIAWHMLHKKHDIKGSNDEAPNKIVGHHPGWANKQTESNIDSDFTAGKSYTGRAISSLLIASSLLVGPQNAGAADIDNRIQTGKYIDILKSNRMLHYEADYVSKLSGINIRNSRKMLIETAIQESGELRYSRQIYKGKPVGRGRSIYMLEPKTIDYLVHDWSAKHKVGMNILSKTSGLSSNKLMHMSRKELSDITMENDLFATGLSRIKYQSSRGKIPDTLAKRSRYWGKVYQGTNNPKKIEQFIQNNKEWSRRISRAMKSNVVGTVGLVAAADKTKIGSKAGTASTKAAQFLKKAFMGLSKI